ncbi:hypothetical protein B0H14DRAFT_2676761 [Mycena olivaceomarginata]|nr:hypothetical protein B0H14DRAFT_2676761 [Mycena olivaceomarginata]
MLKCQILAGAHFIFGILYAVGIVELELESTSALVLLMFVIPLAFTLSGFLLWILYSLNATIAQLRARKQRYKLSMFENLLSAKSWRVRWWLLDGWLALLRYVASHFCSLRMTEDAERITDLDSMGQRGRPDDDDGRCCDSRRCTVLVCTTRLRDEHTSGTRTDDDEEDAKSACRAHAEEERPGSHEND